MIQQCQEAKVSSAGRGAGQEQSMLGSALTASDSGSRLQRDRLLWREVGRKRISC